jgi:hypothetical protein
MAWDEKIIYGVMAVFIGSYVGAVAVLSVGLYI